MTRKFLSKLIIDIFMLIMLLLAFAYNFTGHTSHEFLGLFMILCLVIHNFINRTWYRTVFRKKINISKVLNLSINSFLILSLGGFLISGVMISKVFFPFISIENGLFGRQIHTFSAYWFLILIAIHIGIHWNFIMKMLQKKFYFSRIGLKSNIFIVFSIVFLGFYASFKRNIGAKLFFHSSFDYWDIEQSTVIFFLSYLFIMGMYIIFAHYTVKCIYKFKYLFLSEKNT